ncbi:hypothetical protein HMPREF3187_00490 [Aerococcus christensenii]|uniref:Uncharacterized protein n=1 Tax=Aerococcus christensenii TaxID=87541 RepID=A0A133Y350_9LACT|nr:hypothetical protein HMPREF3187_00490 [Aerococcus christensenii]
MTLIEQRGHPLSNDFIKFQFTSKKIKLQVLLLTFKAKLSKERPLFMT